MLGDNTLNSADACHNDSLHLFVTILTIFCSFYHNPTVFFIRIKKTSTVTLMCVFYNKNNTKTLTRETLSPKKEAQREKGRKDYGHHDHLFP